MPSAKTLLYPKKGTRYAPAGKVTVRRHCLRDESLRLVTFVAAVAQRFQDIAAAVPAAAVASQSTATVTLYSRRDAASPT